MILRIKLLSIFLFSGMFFLLCSLQLPAITPEVLEAPQPVFNWLLDNWEAVALIVSETAALVSLKYSGIVKSVLAFLTACVKKKCFLNSTSK